MVAIGKTAREFEMEDLRGKISLAEFSNKSASLAESAQQLWSAEASMRRCCKLFI
jgi:hypothetical protein